MKVALDLDGVVAFTYDVAFRLMGVDDEYSYDDIESWAWGLDKFGDARFLNAVWHSWTLRSHEIEPMEDPRQIDLLYSFVDKLDIVTADPGHYGIKDAKRSWLDKWGIPYDELRISPMGGSKTQYDYGVFIDDNPHLPSQMEDDQLLLLRDAPYNREAPGAERDNVVRVDSIGNAHEWLRRHEHELLVA